MAQRGVAEVHVRAMLERASGWRPSGVERRYLIDVRHEGRPWIVIIEPDHEARLAVIVTVDEVFK